MDIFEVLDEDKEAYNNFVTAHESGSFLQSWDWGDWQKSLGHKPHRFAVTKLNQTNFLLTAQVMEVALMGKKKYLYIPYGPIIKDEGRGTRDEVVDFFLSELQKKFPDALFIRIEPKQNLKSKILNLKSTPHIQPGNTLLLNLDKSEQELLQKMHEKTRYNIRLAERHGVKVVSELIVTPGYGLHLAEVVNLLVATAERQGYKDHGTAYYRDFINFFGLPKKGRTCQLTVYKALLGQELLACGLMLDFAGVRTYLFGGSSNRQKNVMAPYLLHWQAIKDAQRQGLNFYDFWGLETARGSTPGFVRFKLGFGGQTVNYPPAVDLVKNKLWYNIYNMLRWMNRKF